MLCVLILFIVVTRSRELTSIWSSVSMMLLMPEKQACHRATFSLYSFIKPTIKCLAWDRNVLQRNCTLRNAIQSRDAGVCPGVGVGVGIETPTPESESTPMKTLSTPQPWLLVHTTCISHIFYISDMRSGQFVDLSIISQWRNIEICSVKKIHIRKAQFFLDHAIIGHSWLSICNFWSVTPPRVIWAMRSYSGVTNGFMPIVIGLEMVSLSLSYGDVSIHMQLDLLRSPHDLDLRSNFDFDLSRSSHTCFNAYWQGKHDGVNIIALSFKTRKP